jgi:hypothetical protein
LRFRRFLAFFPRFRLLLVRALAGVGANVLAVALHQAKDDSGELGIGPGDVGEAGTALLRLMPTFFPDGRRRRHYSPEDMAHMKQAIFTAVNER